LWREGFAAIDVEKFGPMSAFLAHSGHLNVQASRVTGWRWSEHVKPIAGTPSCQAAHTGYVLEGRMVVKMDHGAQIEYGPGDAFYMPPGHDAWYRCREWSRTIMVGEITRKR